MGTRLRPAVSGVPKPMALVNGKPFLEYLLDYWSIQGVDRFILSVGYLKAAIVDHFGVGYRGCLIEYVSEDMPLGTGGACLLAAQKITEEEYFLLLNGDTFFEVSLQKLFTHTITNNADCCFSLFRSNEALRYMGLELDNDGRIKTLNSGKAEMGNPANGGVYCLRRSALMEQHFALGSRASLEEDIFPAALAKQRRLLGLEFSGNFIDIGLPADYLRAPQILRN